MTDPTQSASQQTWKVTLSYDGTDFRGWQIQPGERTIQGELQAALMRITGESPLPQGSGRTDAGVHALAQVASFTLAAPIPPENLHRALNRILPPSIRILETTIMPGTFHARHSAVAKTYEYHLLSDRTGNGTASSPFQSRYVYVCSWPLSFESLQTSALAFVGTHDFTSFAATDPEAQAKAATSAPVSDVQPPSSIRTIYASSWEQRSFENSPLFVYSVRGNGFLHHMVRNLVGTMLDVARGQLAPEAIPAILAARSRSLAGHTAPARGLLLHSVEYDPSHL